MTLRLTSKEANACIAGGLNFSGEFGQHSEASTDMKPANDYWDISSDKVFRQINRARELICLHTNEADHASKLACHLSNN